MIPIYKKPLVFAFACILSFTGLLAQSTNQNYIRTQTMLNETGSQYIDQIDYYDGLGRPVQQVLKTFTAQKRDLVSMKRSTMPSAGNR